MVADRRRDGRKNIWKTYGGASSWWAGDDRDDRCPPTVWSRTEELLALRDRAVVNYTRCDDRFWVNIFGFFASVRDEVFRSDSWNRAMDDRRWSVKAAGPKREIVLDDGRGWSGRYPYVWLRNNCVCSSCASAESGGFRDQVIRDFRFRSAPVHFKVSERPAGHRATVYRRRRRRTDAKIWISSEAAKRSLRSSLPINSRPTCKAYIFFLTRSL